MAADPDTGHIFVLESGNNRISEFDAEESWSFVKAWGWGVRDGAAELQTCTAATGCIAGLGGSGAGQIRFAADITLDEEGSIWVSEPSLSRVQKFSPAGEFLLMVGREVNKTRVKEREEQEANSEPVTVTEAEENLCTAASGDECGAGTEGTGDGQLKFPDSLDASELGSSGIIYVGDEDRILEFAEDGTYQGDIPLPGAGRTEGLAVAPDGSLYAISQKVTEKVSNGKELVDSKVVREIGPAGEEIRRLKGQWQDRTIPKDPRALAVDAEENVYVAATVIYELPPPQEGDPPLFEPAKEVIAFEADGDLISFEPGKAGFGAPTDASNLVSLATNVVGDGSGEPGEVLVGHFDNGVLSGTPLSYIRVYGRAFKPKPAPPVIEDQYVTSATAAEASVEALINPRFTSDTAYQVEYGTGKCSEGGCENIAPLGPVQLGGGAVNVPQKASVSVAGLEAGTTYYFRFRAENEITDKEESGPVFGAEGTFRTYAAPTPPEPCSNDPVRIGPSMLLPDCRAYEMVSPVDKEGGRIHARGSIPGFQGGLDQTAPSGETLTYSSERAFADPKSAPFNSQYLAHRDSGSGWSTEPISPPQEKNNPNQALDTDYRAFSEDLKWGWLRTDFDPPLAEGGIEGFRNLYRRDNETGAYGAQCPAQPLETAGGEYLLEPQGTSADGSHLVFWGNGRLLPEAAPGKVLQVYECVNGSELRLVSVLPGGEASPVGGSAGSGYGSLIGSSFRENNVAGAVSDDGSRIFWTAGGAPGPFYVRIDGATTIEIAPDNARFRAASSDGTRVLYSVGGELFEAEVDADSASSDSIAEEVRGFMGASEDATLVYFVSREDLDGGGPGQAGLNNLYLYRAEAGSFTFIAALSADDARETFLSAPSTPILTPVAQSPYNRSSRVTPDGLHAAFTSTAPLTGYDNTDQQSGEADAEVFLYDAVADVLVCASCNPSGARPRGATVNPLLTFWAAAQIPGWQTQSHASRVLADDGERLLFEATDPLALGDTNGVQDVYQWQAPGSGTCSEESSTFSPQNGGCVDLISTGKSKEPSEIVDVSAGGADVFFKTAQSLWPEDANSLDIYDARVNGGFPPPPPPEPECDGAACQSPSPPPEARVPGSYVFVGPGNAVEQPKKPKKCRKGTRKVRKAGKVRCVKSKGKGKAGTGRRAGR